MNNLTQKIQTYYIKNREKILEQRKKYYQNNKKRVLKKNKDYYLDNKKKISIYQKKYHLNNKEKLCKQAKKYYLDNKEIILKKHGLYVKNKRKININFKLKNSLRSRIHHALKNNSKSESTMKLMNCSIEKLKQHLAKKFYSRIDGLKMSFDNYGLWHIDHIRPCASFDLSKADEQAKCFHYTNLQPLWAKENKEKRDKIC